MNKLLALALLFAILACSSEQETVSEYSSLDSTQSQSAQAAHAMVSSAHPLATGAGLHMLERGGNAVDAAVATAFTLSVVEPSMSGLGGRLQAIVHLPSGEVRGVDATTQAPLSYDAETAPEGKYGYPAIGIPGVVAGLCKLQREYGVLPLIKVMEPAIHYAREGFKLLPGESTRHALAIDQLHEFEGSRRYYLKNDSSTYEAGELLIQQDLASTLEAIAEQGEQAFYQGSIAQRIIADIQANGGVLNLDDLSKYEARDADVLKSSYQGHDLYALSMPSYGAITLEILNILEQLEVDNNNEVEWATAMYLAIERAYQDRKKQSADSIPILISKAYARQAAQEILSEATISKLQPDKVPDSWLAEEGHTTHLSVADSSGMMIALTQSLGPNMGSKVASPGLGFLYAVTLGGYLGDFEPGERAASHISPIIITKNNKPYMALGAAGGSKIVSAVSSVTSRIIDQKLNLADALAAPRVHPDDADSVLVETHQGEGWQDEVLEALLAKGYLLHEVPEVAKFGRVHAVMYEAESGQFIGAADPDWEGTAAGL
ncbi:gamma-glutamyltransferase family protein [Porifericola rhodea]|uniref:gamma-glutamyltransferase family protein n=1 Tax=Porifericola rhodea TaxID=930972 RepID=UPI002666E5C0|nr:gamma-glutamyltransferase family protein [Porifericola rhodea]WKN29702.1 gamma-glutamyltransferase family protein [Porifericola rhodea]